MATVRFFNFPTGGGYPGATTISGTTNIPPSPAPSLVFFIIPIPTGINQLFSISVTIVVIAEDDTPYTLTGVLSAVRNSAGVLQLTNVTGVANGGAIKIDSISVFGNNLQVEITPLTLFQSLGYWAYSVSPPSDAPFNLP